MASNPRIDDLRRRIEKEPGSRLFAQLGEELRKEGNLEEAIRVCREGLGRHPAYPSARMTLGRALFDKGELAEARREFEAVLKTAPDNILASRLLGECLEGLGDLAAARTQYQATLALAPGDRQVVTRLEGLGRAASGPAGAASPPTAAAPAPAVVPAAAVPAAVDSGEPTEPPPIPVAALDEPMELEQAHERGQSLYPTSPARSDVPEESGAEPPPIPLSAAEELFELESPFEARGTTWQTAAEPPAVTGAAPAAPTPPAPSTVVPEDAAAEFEFDLESGSTAPVPVVSTEPVVAPAWVQPEDAAPPGPPAFNGRDTAAAAVPRAEAAPPEDMLPLELGAAVEPTASAEPAASIEVAPIELSPEAPAEVPAAEVPPAQAPVAVIAPVEAPAPAEVASAGAAAQTEIASPTLAELYFAQGFRDKAADVLREVLRREPGNERARDRLGEIESAPAGLAAPAQESPAAPGEGMDPARARQEALQRTIARLEQFLAAVGRLRA